MMVSNTIAILLGAAALLNFGCHAGKAIDATINMDKKMNDMGAKTDALDDKMGYMKSSIRKQTLKHALEETINDKTQVITQAFAGATVFGETATPEEIIKTTYVYLKSIDLLKENNNYAPGFGGDTPGQKEHLDKMKLETKLKRKSWYLGVAALAWATPKEKVSEIIKTEIEQKGPYEATAYKFLALRSMVVYIRINGLDMENVSNINQLSEEVEKLHIPTQASFASRIAIDVVRDSDEEHLQPFNLVKDTQTIMNEVEGKVKIINTERKIQDSNAQLYPAALERLKKAIQGVKIVPAAPAPAPTQPGPAPAPAPAPAQPAPTAPVP